MFAEMATELHSQGSTVQSYLKGLYEKCVFVLGLTSSLVYNSSLDTVISRCVTAHSLSAEMADDGL